MKAKILINRHILTANKKSTKQSGVLVDNPAIAIKTYKSSVYCKRVELAPGVKLIQDASNPLPCGATVYITVDDVDSLVI